MKEPSVLDYVKAKLTFWKPVSLEIPPEEPSPFMLSDVGQMPPTAEGQTLPDKALGEVEVSRIEDPLVALKSLPWCSLAALSLALAGQRAFDRPDHTLLPGLIFYILAVGLLIWAVWKREWQAAPLPAWPERVESESPMQTQVDLTIISGQLLRLSPRVSMLLGISFCFIAFLSFGGNLFTWFNFTVWLLGLAFLINAFWHADLSPGRQPLLNRLRVFLALPGWRVSISHWMLLLLAVAGVAVFFRFYRLNEVPPEMFSDHAEKLLDVYDVLHGETHIFFPRNTGREGFQIYLTAVVILICGTSYSFLSLKIGTALAGLFTLPYIYLLGKEAANKRVGMLAALFAGIAYWPNVISRVALRFSLYPLFTAPCLYYLVRGLRTRNRNDFILSGICLGVGLHGYSPIRVLPFVCIIAVGLYLLHRQSRGWRKDTITGLALLALISLVLFLPLLRYAFETPDMFSYRTMTRMGSAERPLPGPAWQIFLQNSWNVLTMFAWDDGEIWVHSVPHRPALDVVSGALFHLGVILLLLRYLRHRHWLDLFLLLSIPLLMMPSVLSLAFPAENPSLNRTGGAIIPVFFVVGLALDGLLSALDRPLASTSSAGSFPSLNRGFAVVLVAFLLSWSLIQNYDLVFKQYQHSFQLSAWNTSEIGRVIRGFADSVGRADRAWVIPYPHWVDTRLVGMNAGYPTTDYALWSEDFETTLDKPETKMFILKPDDGKSLQLLRELYPLGLLKIYQSRVEGKDFYIYLVPPSLDE
jgi:hypothetical protein